MASDSQPTYVGSHSMASDRPPPYAASMPYAPASPTTHGERISEVSDGRLRYLSSLGMRIL